MYWYKNQQSRSHLSKIYKLPLSELLSLKLRFLGTFGSGDRTTNSGIHLREGSAKAFRHLINCILGEGTP